MTMPLTLCTIAASTSAVCLGVEFWPSLSIRLTPSASASALIWFIMCTKNGKLQAGDRAQEGQLVLREGGRRSRSPARQATDDTKNSRLFIDLVLLEWLAPALVPPAAQTSLDEALAVPQGKMVALPVNTGFGVAEAFA